MTAARSGRYTHDVLAAQRHKPPPAPEVEVRPGLVVEDRASGFCGDVVDLAQGFVTLRDRHGRQRQFPLTARGFSIDGRPVTLVRPRPPAPQPGARRTASGSVAGPVGPAQVARASRILVEGIHDAALVERVWGDDLRALALVVEPLHGIEDLAGVLSTFQPTSDRRLGVLLDHLVPGSKEARIAAAVRNPHVRVAGHPYVDVWQGVRPRAVGIAAWPVVPRGRPWKEGVCQALGWADPQDGWRRVLAAVTSYADLEVPLVGAVEQLIDFVTEGMDSSR
jgi:hypothetical protein